MSYGQNQAWGLQAIKTINGGTWNGQTSSYLIQSGYGNNIFKGDLVFLGANGYIQNLCDANMGVYGAQQAIGVFNGCSFSTTTATNPIDPSSPGRPYWPAGTMTLNGVPATCDIIDDPSVIFNIQCDGVVPLGIGAQGQTASVSYVVTGVPPNAVVQGNFTTGISLMVLATNTAAVGNATFNLRILRLVNTPGNLPGIAYNNFEVLIQNHSFVQRAVGI